MRADEAAARRVLARKHKPRDVEAYRVVRRRCLQLERALAASQGEEAAVELEWPERWCSGAPLPHVVSAGSRTILIYLLDEPDPNWDGSQVEVVDPTAGAGRSLGLVEFEGCYLFQFGGPNDEVFAGHRLSGRGLSGYGAYLVENSAWIAEQMRINSVHSRYEPTHWSEYRHYVLAFHDEMFECIARGHRVEVIRESFAAALRRATNRLTTN